MIKIHLIALISLGIFSCSDVLPEIDYLLAVDTSASMQMRYSKEKKKRISLLDALKNELKDFIGKVKEDDTIHLFKFDTDIKLVGRIEIEEEEDREKAIRLIHNLKADGAWTFTLSMLSRIQREAEILRDDGRQTVILIFSDGLDDPPPKDKKLKFSLPGLKKESKDEYKEFKAKNLLYSLVKKEEFIYYVTLNKLENDVIKNKIKQLSSEAKTISADEDIGEGLADIARDIEKKYLDKYVYKNTLLHYIGGGLGGLLIVFFIFWYLYRIIFRVRGRLIYFEKGFMADQKATVVLNKLKKTKIIVGQRIDSHLRIKELELKKPFLLKTGKNIFSPCVKFENVPEEEFEFIPPKNVSYIKSGDKFRIANIEFEYLKK
jgi:hypothetical protein